MTPQEIKDAARHLYTLRLKNGAHWIRHEYKRFIIDVRKLAKQIPQDVTLEKELDLSHAQMYLDSIALRENIYLEYAPKRSK